MSKARKEMITKVAVFRCLCASSNNWYGVEVFSSKFIAERLNISRYAVLKALHSLRDMGYVERASMGCPAVAGGYEYVELEHEAAPPINGFAVTEKGINSNIYKREIKKYDNSFEKWV